VTGGISQQVPGGMTIDVTQELGPDDMLPNKSRNRQFQATVTQPLLRGAGLTASMATVRGSTYDERAREADLRDLERQTVFNVKLAYYNAVRDVELLRVNRSTLDADSLLVEASNAMVEAKVASRRDVLSARIRLADDASTVVASERDALTSLDLLKDVMGIPLETAIGIADTSLNAHFVTLDEAKLVQKVIDTHPSMRSAELAVSRSRLDLTVARNSRLPQVDLKASYFQNFGQQQLDVGDITRGTGWVASVNLFYPLFDRSSEGETIQRRAELDQAQDRLKFLERQLTLRVREIVRTVRSSGEEVRSIQQTIDAADDKLQFATAMFNLGRASNLDITDARSDLVKARTQMVKKLVDYNAQVALLESLTGEPVAR
jgi:outer membrane protein TolC